MALTRTSTIRRMTLLSVSNREGLRLCARCLVLAVGVACSNLAAQAEQASSATPARDFAYRIQPILSDKCFHCHGPDEAERVTDLRLDTRDGVKEAFPGSDLSESEAWRRITSDDPDEQMPPPEANRPLSDKQRRLMQAWIESGAGWSTHWAFVPPQPIEPPAEFAEHPIDAFVRQRLAQAEVEPTPRATPAKRLRRLAFDLTGLPPTPAEIDDFSADSSDSAWIAEVDRLLASPHYGEKMAVEWLDGARYADTNGYQNDFARTMWPWRDWVIDAFNDNLPFDQFTIEQLAGDLLPNPTDSQRLATGFNRNNRTVTEAGSIPEEWLVENVSDRAETTGSVWLALTVGCARCHDHKYDPVSQREFFEFFAFFNSVNEEGVYGEQRGNVGPTIQYISENQRLEIAALEADVQAAKDTVESIGDIQELASRWYSTATPPTVMVDPDAAIPLTEAPFQAETSQRTFGALPRGAGAPDLEEDFIGPVASFDGERWLEYGPLVEPDADKPFTISAWVRRTGDGAILSKMDEQASYRGIDWLVLDEGRLAIHLIASWPSDVLKVTTENRLDKDRWTHVSVVYDGSREANGVRVYFDADEQPLEVNNDSLAGPLATDEPFRIGRRSQGANFHGRIARVRIFNRVLGIGDIIGVLRSDLLSNRDDPDPPGRPRSARVSRLVEEQLDLYVTLATDRTAEAFRSARAARAEAEERLVEYMSAAVPTAMIMEELPEPRPTYVLRRGEYDKPDKDQPVQPGVPAALGQLSRRPGDAYPNRLDLARWIVSPDNPLTARVFVNRLWAQFFGVGLVKTEENFGIQGSPPSHPDLLDWLAREFVESGWDVQHVVRLIVTSETYQQDSAAPPRQFAEDPENRLLARGPRRRLEAEFLRDNALAASGLLRPRVGGPSVFPYQPVGLWEELAGGAGQGAYEQSEGDDLYRRSLYTYRKRTVPHPTMASFDAPSFEICTVYRSQTNTPLQSLALLNDETYVEAANHLGLRMQREGGDTVAGRLIYGFRLVTARTPNQRELSLLARAFQSSREEFAQAPEAARLLLKAGASPAEPGEASAEELAAYAAVASVLLNLDETITLE